MKIDYYGYAMRIISDAGVEPTDKLIQKIESTLMKISKYTVSEYAKSVEGLINSAITIYVFIKSVIPEADVIRYEQDSRFWFRIGSERFIVEISQHEINVYQFVVGEMWKETSLSKRYKDALNEYALSYGVF